MFEINDLCGRYNTNSQIKFKTSLLTLLRIGFFGAVHGLCFLAPLPKIHHTYPTMMKLDTVIPYLRKIRYFIFHLIFTVKIPYFSPEVSKFCYIKKYTYRLDFDTYFLFFLNFLESLVIVLRNVVIILMMSAKTTTPGLLKIRVFWNNGYGVLISVHDVTNKILSRDSNCIIDVVMWSNFGNCSISMRKVIITSIL